MSDKMIYNINKPWESLDQWQKDYINETGNCFILCGRQSGKSAAMSIKIGNCAVKERNACDYLIIAFTEKQAYQLFFKTLMYLETKYPNMLKRKAKEKPTKHEIRLTNGVIIRCYAAGITGNGLKGFTIKKLFIDEAAPMAREIFTAVSPMLSVTGGTMDISSTPKGKEGYFYECSLRDDFRQFYVSAEDCPRHSKEFLNAEKSRMSAMEYAQEYLAQFLDDVRRVFSDNVIKNCCTLKRRKEILFGHTYYLGVDVAGWGKDESTFEIIDKFNKEKFEQIENIIEKRNLTIETSSKILQLENAYTFKRIGIDDGGVGFGVFSELLGNDKTKRKIEALNNSSRSLVYNSSDEKHNKKLLKEEMYMNLLALMEQGKIKLLDDDELILSLKSVQFEYVIKEGKKTTLRIFGNYTHIVEGLIRSAWLASQDKSLNIFIR
jgi:hypothetical protein